MAALNFNDYVRKHVPSLLWFSVKEWDNISRHSKGRQYGETGIFVHGRYGRWDQDIFLTFFDSDGIKESMEFMVKYHNDIERTLRDTLYQSFPDCAVSYAASTWRWNDNLFAKCGNTFDGGVLVTTQHVLPFNSDGPLYDQTI